MTDITKEAKYRTERNNLLVQTEAMKALLGAAGISDQAVQVATGLFGSKEFTIADGKVTNFAVNDQEKSVLATLVPQGDTKGAGQSDTNKNTDKSAAGQETEAEMTKRITEEVTKTLTAQRAGEAIPDSSGAIPPNSSGNSGGLTIEAVDAMTPEQINANWDQVSAAMSAGTLATPATA